MLRELLISLVIKDFHFYSLERCLIFITHGRTLALSKGLHILVNQTKISYIDFEPKTSQFKYTHFLPLS